MFLLVAAACRREPVSSGPALPGLPSTFRIQGKVLKAEASDHSGILVYCAGTSFQAHTDEKGQYTISGVAPGTYKVLCLHADFEPATVDTISVADGVADPSQPILLPELTLTPKLSPAQRAERILCSVMGQVLLAGESTAENVVVWVVDTDFRTVTTPDGNYQLLRLDPGQYTLVFEKDGFRSQRRSVRLFKGDLIFPETIVLERMPPPIEARVLNGSVTLLDAEGNELNEYKGVLIYVEGTEGTTRMAFPDSEGLFRFDNLPPSKYLVAAAGPSFLSRDRVEADLMDATEATVALTLQSLNELTSAPGTLVGRVLKDDPEDSLAGTLVGIVEVGATAMTDPAGNYAFNNVPPGTYTVVAQADGYFPAGLEEVVITAEETAQAVDVTMEKQRDYPRVLATTPADGERNVTIREIVPLTIRFSKKMQPDSLRAAFSISPPVAFVLHAGREHPMSDFDRLYVELIGYGDQQSLRFNRSYTVSLTTDASDFEGLGLERPYRFSFRTGPASVIGSNPPDGAEGVFVDFGQHRPVVYFNAKLDPRSVTENKVRVRPALNTKVQVSLVDSPVTGWSMIQLIGQWQQGLRYSITVTGGLRTANNSPISNLPFTFQFETSRGRSLDLTPGRGVGGR